MLNHRSRTQSWNNDQVFVDDRRFGDFGRFSHSIFPGPSLINLKGFHVNDVNRAIRHGKTELGIQPRLHRLFRKQIFELINNGHDEALTVN